MKTWTCAGLSAAVCVASGAGAQNLVASYFFQDTLASSTPGAPALVPVNPLGANHFADDSVFGSTKRVYVVDGDALPSANQAGLSLVTSGLVEPRSYSAELVFKFHERQGGWRLILDTHNRQSDQAFYVHPGNYLQVYPVATAGGGEILNNQYHHVVLTVSSVVNSASVVRAYLDGLVRLSVATDIMDLSNAPAGLLHIFADNLVAGGQGEFSDASIALFRLYDAALSPEQVGALADQFLGLPCPCDLNADGLVADDDFVIFLAAYNTLDCEDPAMPVGCPADFTKNGLVDDEDFVVFVLAYNELVCP